MLVLLLDAAGAFLLSRFVSNRWIMVALALALGLVNGYVASVLTALIMDGFQTPDGRVQSMVVAALLHPAICIALSLWFRYRLERAQRS